jgi:(S)-sulfolactate dehydrogenase
VPRVVVTEFMDGRALDRLKAAHDTHADFTLADRSDEIGDLIADAAALVVRNRTRVTAALLDRGPGLKVVGRLGVGLDNIDLEACAARGIEVRPAVGANAASVAEYVIMTAMAMLRKLLPGHAGTLSGGWPRETLDGREIGGRVMGVVGLGSIGLETAWRARALGMTVIAADPYLPADSPAWDEVERVDVPALLARADVVSLHVPLTDETRHLIDAAALKAMRSDALLINSARGGVIDLDAVIAALRSGEIAGAAVDVFDTEPLSGDAATRLADVPGLIATPHIAGVTGEANVRVSEMIVDAVLEVLAREGAG